VGIIIAVPIAVLAAYEAVYIRGLNFYGVEGEEERRGTGREGKVNGRKEERR